VNITGKIGACGLIPNYGVPFAPWGLVKVDPYSMEILRDPETNLAIPCGPGEPGELIGKISSFLPLQEFRGLAAVYCL